MNAVINTIGKGTMWTTIGTWGVKLAGLLATFVTLHQLTVYEYGLTELAVSILPLLSIFALPGITTVVQTEMSIAKAKQDGPKERALLDEYFFAQFFLSLIPFVLVFFGAELISRWYNEGIADLFRITSFAFLLSPFRNVMKLLFQVNLQFQKVASYGMSEELSKFVLLLLCFFVFDLRAQSVIIAYIGGMFLTALGFAPIFFKEYRPLRQYEKSASKRPFYRLIRDHGKWGIATNYLNNFANNIRLWIIKAFFGADAVGLFALASSIYSHMVSLFQLGTVLNPILPRYINDIPRFDRLVSKGIKYQTLGLVFISIGSAIAVPFLVEHFFTQFTPALPLFFIMLLSVFANGVSAILTPLFLVFHAQKSLFFSTVFKTVLIILLTPPLLYFFGVKGIAIEFVITATLFVLERYRALKALVPRFKIDPRSFFVVDGEDYVIIGKFILMIRKFIPRMSGSQ